MHVSAFLSQDAPTTITHCCCLTLYVHAVHAGFRVLLKAVVKQGKVQLKQRLVPQQVRHGLGSSFIGMNKGRLVYWQQDHDRSTSITCNYICCTSVDACLIPDTPKRVWVCACLLLSCQAISRWEAKIESVEPELQRVQAEEREEAALRKAEMEVNKAQVMLFVGYDGLL